MANQGKQKTFGYNTSDSETDDESLKGQVKVVNSHNSVGKNSKIKHSSGSICLMNIKEKFGSTKPLAQVLYNRTSGPFKMIDGRITVKKSISEYQILEARKEKLKKERERLRLEKKLQAEEESQHRSAPSEETTASTPKAAKTEVEIIKEIKELMKDNITAATSYGPVLPSPQILCNRVKGPYVLEDNRITLINSVSEYRIKKKKLEISGKISPDSFLSEEASPHINANNVTKEAAKIQQNKNQQETVLSASASYGPVVPSPQLLYNRISGPFTIVKHRVTAVNTISDIRLKRKSADDVRLTRSGQQILQMPVMRYVKQKCEKPVIVSRQSISNLVGRLSSATDKRSDPDLTSEKTHFFRSIIEHRNQSDDKGTEGDREDDSDSSKSKGKSVTFVI